MARRQHGVVTRSDLRRLGFSGKAIEHRISTGRLRPIWRGVYAVGWAQLTPKRRWIAAVLSCGRDAVLSHGSAAALWGIGRERRARGPAGPLTEVSLRGRRECRRPGIIARTRPSLPAADVTVHDGIPVTTPARTLIDMAAEATESLVERAVNEADKRDLINPEALREAVRERAGQPGARPLRVLLDRHTFRLSDDELERLFRPLALAAGLPQPDTKAIVNGFEVDFHWPELGLVVETDGLRYHRTPAAQARDRARDQTHTAAGITTLRFTHWQVAHEKGRVRGVLNQTAERLRGGADGARR